MAEGPVASSPFASMQAGQAQGQTNSVRFDPASADLELNSVALQPLLGSVFNNPLIAEQLNSRYRLPQELRDVLLAATVVLRVDALEAGRFQASIQARLMLIKPTGSSEVLMPLQLPCRSAGFKWSNDPCCLRMVDPQTVSPMFGSIPRGTPKVDGR